MQVILSGSLRQFPPADLLTFLSSRSTRATCDFEASGRRIRVFLDGATIIGAESSRGGEAVDAVLDLLEWPAGTFNVLDSVTLPDGAKPVSLELAALIDEAKKRALSTSAYADTATFRVVDSPLQGQLSLTGDDLKLLFRLMAQRPFKDLLVELALSRAELTEKLQRLEQLGLILREEPLHKTQPQAPSSKRTLVGSLTPDTAPDNIFPLLDAEQTIGRLPSNNIAIADGSVSSTHARILRTPEGFAIEDLQSRNGTFVNGEKVDAKRLLADGDLIRLGKVMLTFNVAREGKTSDTTQPEARVL